MMFQDEQLFPHLDVAANIAFGPRMHRLAGRQRSPARVDELLTIVGLDGFGGRRVDRLSGGEKKRVALARSLAPRPALLLLDEPLTGLDRELHDRLIGRAGRRVADRTATTAILVTHDRDEAAALASRVVDWATEPPAEISRCERSASGDATDAPVGSAPNRRTCESRPLTLLLPTTIRSASTASATAISTDAGSPT